MARDEPGRFDDLLSLADVEEMVCSGDLRTPGFRLVKAGEKLSASDYTRDVPWRPQPFTGAADVPRVLEEFERGATIVLQALHLRRPAPARFCRLLEAVLGHPVQANAYYTPRQSQGLGVHHDTHDVFVLQVAGDKRWLVYEPVFELPLRDQRYSPEMGGPGEPVHDVVLRPGDTLYMPRGWLHEALTSDSDSLHLTIGVNVYTWIDALRAALDALKGDADARRSVPDDGAMDVDLLERVRELLDADAVAERKRRKLVSSRRPLLDGQISQLRALDELDLETPLELRETVLYDWDGSELSFAGKTLRLPERVGADVEFMLEAGRFAADELPGPLDEAGRLVLVRRLVREGLLRIAT